MKYFPIIAYTLIWWLISPAVWADVAPEPPAPECYARELPLTGTDCQECIDYVSVTSGGTKTSTDTGTSTSLSTYCTAHYTNTQYTYQCERPYGANAVQVWCDGPVRSLDGVNDADDEYTEGTGCSTAAPTKALSLSGLLLLGLAILMLKRQR